MPQEHVHASKVGTKDEANRTDQDDAIDEAVAQAKERANQATAVEDADDWLESIDEALGEWAESDLLARDFVASYIQKGGQ